MMLVKCSVKLVRYSVLNKIYFRVILISAAMSGGAHNLAQKDRYNLRLADYPLGVFLADLFYYLEGKWFDCN